MLSGLSFNWTKVELKLGGAGSDKDINTPFNWTKVELKH